ncbi:hypothetical protein O181_092581 [Austropuccinia psidii MF-1]|uniref:Uncharacterized protein n=1 Tax=Austropuccinia psidii MF-1 TaxID=1389203 RepID=A0A9Q3IZM1_9BASI|nr:hypothetical protein [Austropuccinia psidii MF-1]
MEKKICFSQEQMEERQPSTTQRGAKTSPSSKQQHFQHENAATSPEQGKGQSNSHKTIQRGLKNPKDSTRCHGKFVSDGHNYDGIEEKGGSQSEISGMISEFLDGIPNLYRSINDVKFHVFD